MPDVTWNRQHWTASLKLHAAQQPGYHYGDQWGTPESREHLQAVRDAWVLPFVSPDKAVLEIGSGGGRWTQYLLAAQQLYCVDVNPVMLQYLRQRFGDLPNLALVENSGTDLPGIPAGSIDFAFSFGTFVHLDLHLIDAYLDRMRPLLKPGADVVIQYADKTKQKAANNPHFSEMDAFLMERLLCAQGYRVVRHDTGLIDHSNLIHARPSANPTAEPWPLDTGGVTAVLAWPDYRSAEDLLALFRSFIPAFLGAPACLCLRVDPVLDPAPDQVAMLLEGAFQQFVGSGDLAIVLVTDAMDETQWPRLGRAAQASLALPSASFGRRAAWSSGLGVPRLYDGAATERLIRRS